MYFLIIYIKKHFSSFIIIYLSNFICFILLSFFYAVHEFHSSCIFYSFHDFHHSKPLPTFHIFRASNQLHFIHFFISFGNAPRFAWHRFHIFFTSVFIIFKTLFKKCGLFSVRMFALRFGELYEEKLSIHDYWCRCVVSQN